MPEAASRNVNVLPRLCALQSGTRAVCVAYDESLCVGGICTSSRCCETQSFTCYTKNPTFARCLTRCPDPGYTMNGGWARAARLGLLSFDCPMFRVHVQRSGSMGVRASR